MKKLIRSFTFLLLTTASIAQTSFERDDILSFKQLLIVKTVEVINVKDIKETAKNYFTVYNNGGKLIVLGEEVEKFLIFNANDKRVDNINLDAGIYLVSIMFKNGEIKTKEIIIYE